MRACSVGPPAVEQLQLLSGPFETGLLALQIAHCHVHQLHFGWRQRLLGFLCALSFCLQLGLLLADFTADLRQLLIDLFKCLAGGLLVCQQIGRASCRERVLASV